MSFFDGLTWACHVCNNERPDDAISVMKRVPQGRRGVEHHLRYCNDRDCRVAAIRWQEKGNLLVEAPMRWWELTDRVLRALLSRRRFPGCIHPFPTYGDERGAYGLRCGVCFIPVTPKEWP